MRTLEVARLAGCSAQQVRKLESSGVLPPATRTDSGYRQYGHRHVASLRAYREFTAAVGPVEARLLMIAAHRDVDELLARLDGAHAELDRERQHLHLTRSALRAIEVEPMTDIRPSDAMTVGELALALDVRPSTLRHWESEGLLRPGRGVQRARLYMPSDVRDARLVHQLRQAGHRINPLRELLDQLRHTEDFAHVLADRADSIHERSRALLRATATLHTLLENRQDQANDDEPDRDRAQRPPPPVERHAAAPHPEA